MVMERIDGFLVGLMWLIVVLGVGFLVYTLITADIGQDRLDCKRLVEQVNEGVPFECGRKIWVGTRGE